MQKAAESASSAVAAAASFAFARTASAEDETVGAIRTRVMNAQFVKQRSSLGTVKENAKFDPKKGMSALRSISMPSKLMKQVLRDEYTQMQPRVTVLFLAED